MISKLKNDSQLRLIVLLGLTAAAAVAAFSVYRLSQGHWSAAAIDLVIVAVLCAPVIYALRTGDTRRSGLALCVINSIACAAASWVIGTNASHWLYLVLMSNFFITTPVPALVSNIVLTITVLSMQHLFGSPLHTVAVAVTATLSILFAYLFALQVREDQMKLENLASLDVLTGVPNRRMMERSLTVAVDRHREGEGNFGLVILDLDNFKDVNDTFGHAVGDAAIADLATILKFEMRRNDSVFRFGGEEFVVLVTVDTREELHALTERLRLAVRKGLRGPGGSITVSLGAALLSSEDRWQEWFSLADAALYRAKNLGRDNSVVCDIDD